MTTTTEILNDAFGRVHGLMHDLLSGLDADTLMWRADPEANPIGWLAWHLTRVQDDHLAGVAAVDQVWTAQDFADRFALPYPPSDIGFGQTSAQVGAFRVTGIDLLLDYHDAVHAQTLAILAGLDEAGYSRIVDRRWDPPVTAAVRLVSVVGDTLQHLGQIGYVRGLADRARPIAR